MAHHKPHPVLAAHEQLKQGWGWSQTRVTTKDSGDWVNWLYAWQNPHPEAQITAIRFEPVSGAIVVSAISAGNVAEHPLRWLSRRKAVIRLPEGTSFEPEQDEHGNLSQIRLDLGQVISAGRRLVYPDGVWDRTYNNQLPVYAENEILVEYTAHPEACFHLSWGKIVPLSDVEEKRQTGLVYPVAKAERTVKLRVIDRSAAGQSQPSCVMRRSSSVNKGRRIP